MDWRPAVDRPGTRAIRLAGFGLLAVALGVMTATVVLPLAVRGFVRAIELTMNACVWLATTLTVGMSAWTVLGVVGRTATGMVNSRQASLAISVLVAIGALAAYGLQRLLGSEEE